MNTNMITFSTLTVLLVVSTTGLGHPVDTVLQGDRLSNDINIDEFDRACYKPADVMNRNEHNNPEDKERRRKILEENKMRIQKVNADPNSTSTARVNCMSDKTLEEVEKMSTGMGPPPSEEEIIKMNEKAERELLGPLRLRRNAMNRNGRRRMKSLSDSVDLVKEGRVSEPKHQDYDADGRRIGCGSCAVFAAVSAIESCMHKVTGVLPTDLSEQHMLDCAYGVGGNGCDGGSSDRYNEWMYRNHNGGLANEAEYPYRAATGPDQCRNSTIANANHGALVTSHQEGWTATEEDVMRLLSQGHSVTTGMQVVSSFYSLGSGIFQSNACKNCRNADGSANSRNCPQNHDITIVGYGEENGVKFWKLKNSWGTGWGEGGFGKILRGDGHCGLGIDFSVPICTASVGCSPKPDRYPNDCPHWLSFCTSNRWGKWMKKNCSTTCNHCN